MISVLHVYSDDDTMAARYVAMLTAAASDSAVMASATSTRAVTAALRSTTPPDIVHVHARPRISVPSRCRIVITPHGHPVADDAKAYVIVARSQMERDSLPQQGARIETVRNPIITRSITPDTCARQMMAIYRRVMDSHPLQLMDDDTRRFMAGLLAAAVYGDARWVAGVDSRVSQAGAYRLIYNYADHEGVLPLISEGLRLLGISAPPYEPVTCYLPAGFSKPKPMEGSSIADMLEDLRTNGPTLLRLTEMARALHDDSLDEKALLSGLEERKLLPLMASTLQLLAEQLLLTEGFMPCPPVNNATTRQLRARMEGRMEVSLGS